ncbi:coiled-coil domain-containing protein [Stappia indica]|uniref:hypothetical protein n=1 Tax=Stappia indica TaxID=538381 RepID=UPI001CD1ABEB|nr:hypothetical protein [Stappia indica]MCA1298199.1 hypothetical protein [Stappia indica]
MIEAAMYMALGFFIAGLIAIAILPAVWRRAVRLTRRAVEATSPMSHADVRAEISGLRAAHALECRRLEINLQQLHEQATANRLARDRAEAASSDMRKEVLAREQALADAQEREDALHRDILEREEALARAKARMRELERVVKRRNEMAEGEADEAQSAPTPPSGAGAREWADASHLTQVAALESEIAALRLRLKTGETAAGADGTDRAAQRARDDRLFEAESRLVSAQAEIARLSLQLEESQQMHAADDPVHHRRPGDAAETAAAAARLEAENARLRAQLQDDVSFQALRTQLADLAASVVASVASDEELAALAQDTARTPPGASDLARKAASLSARIQDARQRLNSDSSLGPRPRPGAAQPPHHRQKAKS